MAVVPQGSLNAKLFINYRREDTAPYAGRLYDRLTAHFGANQVFMDIDQIEPGEDFVEAINSKVGSCDIAIVSIGPNWLNATDAWGQRRLDDTEDFVRMEIIAALERKIRVIPVLVGGARMPRKQDLPEALAPLSRRNAIELSETRFHSDVSRLIEAIERPRSLPEKKTEPAPPVKLADTENPPETAEVRPPAEPFPEPVALIAEPTPPVKLAESENLPQTSPPPPPAVPNRPPSPPPAPRSQAPAAAVKGRYFGWVLLGLACFVPLSLLFVVSFVTHFFESTIAQSLVHRLEYNGLELSYNASVTEAEAKKLGDYLVKDKFFAEKPPAKVQINKTGTTYELRVNNLKEGTQNEDSVITYFRDLGRRVSLNVFDKRPVAVHIGSGDLKTVRVIPP